VLIVWSDSLEAIIPTCADFDSRLIKLLWRARPQSTSATNTPCNSTIPPTIEGGGNSRTGSGSQIGEALLNNTATNGAATPRGGGVIRDDPDKDFSPNGGPWFRRMSWDPDRDRRKSRDLDWRKSKDFDRRKGAEGKDTDGDGDGDEKEVVLDDDSTAAEEGRPGESVRKTMLFAPLYDGLAVALATSAFPSHPSIL
jgi:hypothetical protein